MARLTTKQRKSLSSKSFALSKRRYPITDKAHARAAMSYASRPGYTTAKEKKRIANKIRARFPALAKRSKFVRKWGSK